MTQAGFCWICEQGWVASADPIITDPRTGEWAHDRCCDRTLAGAMWRLRLALRHLGRTTWEATIGGKLGGRR